MTTERDKLDAAIDQVAARMTAVHEDADLTTRLVATLPDRSMFGGWLFQSWAPRLAVIAIVAIGAALWNQNGVQRPSPSPASKVSDTPAALVAFAPVVVPNRPRTRPLEPLEPLERLEPSEVVRADHERSLPVIEAMTALGMSSLAPGDLPVSEALTLAPIEIAELPMTAENFSPR